MTIHSMNITEVKEAAVHRCRPRRRTYFVIISVVVLVVVAGVLAGYFLGSTGPRAAAEPPDPLEAPPPSWSKLHRMGRAAVCTDGPPCSAIGRDVLARNGTAVDAAIAAMFCNGLVNMASMGVGGGFFMTVYIRSEARAYSVVAREQAPGGAAETMFADNPKAAQRGALAVAVPGEVRGMWEAHRRWGALDWSELVAPSLKLCRDGFNMSAILHDGVKTAAHIMHDAHLRKTFYNEKTNKFHRAGTLVRPSEEFCRTLERLAAGGGDEFYNGSLASDLLADLRDVGSIITQEDLRRYQPKISDPIEVQLSDGNTLYTPPPPSSGLLLGFILNILSGYNFNNRSIADTNSSVLTYHRIVEAFKYAYSTRTMLGDIDFLDLKELVHNVTSTEYAAAVRSLINDNQTYEDPKHYGAKYARMDDHGTAHISIIAPNGDAVSITSSINYYFGAGFTGKRTGINFNNVMDDFSSPGITNYFGIEPSPANYIKPYKRPLSSMSPSIIVDRNMNAKMVIGASGGSKITTAMALVIIRKLWFEQSIKEAVDAPRLHHQILPMQIEYEYGNTEGLITGLVKKGHKVKRYRDRGSIVCALFRNSTAIYGNADYRKGGEIYGID